MIKNESKVTFHYTLKVEGRVLGSSVGKSPASYVHGSGQIIPGLEEEMEGMQPGESREITVQPEKGYGDHDPAAVQKVPKSAFYDADNLKEGETVMGSAGGRDFQARVAGVSPDEITLDLNHPLAGKRLDFSVEVVSVD